jgi:hypothetical protein
MKISLQRFSRMAFENAYIMPYKRIERLEVKGDIGR